LLAADAAEVSGRVFNVADGRSISLLVLIDALNKLLGTQVQARFAPPRVGDIRESLADITAARRYLGYEPQVDFHEGLRRSIDYYRSIVGRKPH
jgi:UDP-glucose 4-epimerase